MVPGYNAPFASDFYMKDIATGEVWWISRTRDNSMPDGFFSGVGAINSNGTVVVFGSSGTKFVQENTDPGGGSSMDLFRVDIGAAGAVTTTLITKAVQGNANVDFFSGPYLPGTGEYVAFNAATLQSLIGQGTDNAFFKHGVGVGALPAGVVSTTPALTVSESANQLTLSWPAATGFTPEFLTNLGQGGWTAVSATPTLNNGVQSLELPLEGKTKFFRLRRTAE
jgi:hypothetical protein